MSGKKPYRTLADVLGDDAFDEQGRPLKQSSNGNENYQVKGWRPMRMTTEPAYTVISGPASLFDHDFEGNEEIGRKEARRRRLTVQEMARIQSFPWWFEFRGDTVTSRRQQVGNAVPPRVAKHLAQVVV